MIEILAVVTSHPVFNGHDVPTGLWLSELTDFYAKATAAGMKVDIVSIDGGKVPLDPVSLRPLNVNAETRRYYADPIFMKRLNESVSIKDIDPSKYNAIYFAGGHGAMYDFPNNPAVQNAILTIDKQGGVISAVCHGPAALLDLKTADGRSFIAGKKVTGFSGFEEVLAFRKDKVPYILEDHLKTEGASYNKAGLPFVPHVVVDGRLVTGQNPQSASAVAENVIDLLQKGAKQMSDTARPPAQPSDTQPMVEVQLGNHIVHVPQGGLFDRYRMHTDLDEVVKDPRVPGVDFFRQLPKTEVQSPIGPTMTPNFYYSVSTARLTMLAPVAALKARLPAELSPLEVMPGYGAAAVMFYRYDVADIDFYTEVGVGILVKPARHGPLGAIDLIANLKNEDLHTYVLSLPVNTDIAQVRGAEAYGLPKWVTDIDIQIDEKHAVAQVANDKGGIDLSFAAVTPKQNAFQSGKNVSSLTTYTQLQGAWHEVISQTNVLRSGRQLFPHNVQLRLGQGRLSDDLRSLHVGKLLSLDVSTSSQVALNLPIPFYISK